MQQEAVVRVMAADLADDPAAVLQALRSLAEEIAAGRAGIAEGERIAAGMGHRGDRLLLQHRMAHRMLDALEAWIADVERLLTPA